MEDYFIINNWKMVLTLDKSGKAFWGYRRYIKTRIEFCAFIGIYNIGEIFVTLNDIAKPYDIDNSPYFETVFTNMKNFVDFVKILEL